MPYVSIPRDISKVKSRIFFGMTVRQLICVVCAVAVAGPTYWLLRKPLGDFALYLSMVLATPFGLAAFFQHNGQPFEKYFMTIIRWRFRPRMRYYQSNNVYRQLQSQIMIYKEIRRYAAYNKGQIKNKAPKKWSKNRKYNNRYRKGIDSSPAEKSCC